MSHPKWHHKYTGKNPPVPNILHTYVERRVFQGADLIASHILFIQKSKYGSDTATDMGHLLQQHKVWQKHTWIDLQHWCRAGQGFHRLLLSYEWEAVFPVYKVCSQFHNHTCSMTKPMLLFMAFCQRLMTKTASSQQCGDLAGAAAQYSFPASSKW